MHRHVIILIILLGLCPFNARSDDSVPKPFSPERLQRQIKSVERLKIDTFMQVLAIKQGMTVLDLRAGTGQYSYKFAEKLKGTGKVFATDIDRDDVNYMRRQAQARNLTNLFPVLVNQEGLDEFYTKNKFDLIFVGHAYTFFHDRVKYFKDLGRFLTPDGRLAILANKASQKFFVEDISDVDGLARELSSEKPDSPFYSDLRESTRELLRHPLDNETRALLKKAIVEDFNKMEKDHFLMSYFLANFFAVSLIFHKYPLILRPY